MLVGVILYCNRYFDACFISVLLQGVHDDSGYNADDDISVGDGESGYYGRAVHGGGVQYQVVLLLDHVEVSSV
jgi:hypothetical protein